MQSIRDTFQLKNGVRIPCVGFGTWQVPDGDIVRCAVKDAISIGYRHIDTAAVYGNEVGVGLGVRESGVDRDALFITSKLWNTMRGYDTTLKAFDESLKRLALDYLDLYLIHWPANKKQFPDCEQINRDTWRAMETLYKSGRVKAIGVSNFLKHHLENIMQTAEIAPMVDQLQFHPGYMQKETVSFCKENGILVEAWSPLGSGEMLTHPLLVQIAEKYGVSVAQLLLRWALAHEILPLPKSVTKSRIAQNADLFGFTIAKADMQAINDLPFSLAKPATNPDAADF